MKPPDSRDCPRCKTDYNTIYQCERCGSTWNIPDAPSKKDIVEKMADAYIARNGWHDAKTDPPKEGKYLVGWKGGHWNVDSFFDGKWFCFPNVPPDYYMIVPEPPKES